MKLRPILACAAMVLSLTACDRIKRFLPAADDAAKAAKGSVCSYKAPDYQFVTERQQEDAAIKANPGLVERQGDTLTFFHAGKPVASNKDCTAFYKGNLNLLNRQTGAIEAYSTFSSEPNETVIVDHDGTPFAFDGQLAASPDGRYVASGDGHADYLNAPLTITDWTSAGLKSRVEFNRDCSPGVWVAGGLQVICKYTSGVMTRTADGWQLQETRIDETPEYAPGETKGPPIVLQRLDSEILWPEDILPDFGNPLGYRPVKGDAAYAGPPDTTIRLLDGATGKLVYYPLSAKGTTGHTFLLKLDKDTAYDVGRHPKASADGRWLATFDRWTPLVDWAGDKTEIAFDGLYCIDGAWTSAVQLTVYCQGGNFSPAHYSEGLLTRGGDGTWTYAEITPVRRALGHVWARYTVKGFTPRRILGTPRPQPLLNQIDHPAVEKAPS